MRSTRIVTSFIEGEGKFLILKRSHRVKTMKGLWAGISGIIENNEDPLSRAKIEIFEELGVREDKIQLVNTAKKMSITSPQYKNHRWTIFPFLFSASNITIRLNWENSEYKWVSLDEIKRHRTVPNLNKVLLKLLK